MSTPTTTEQKTTTTEPSKEVTPPTSQTPTPTPAPAPSSDPSPAPTPTPNPSTEPTPPKESIPEPKIEEYELELSEESPLSEEELNAIAEYASKHNLPKDEAEFLIKQQESLYNKGLSKAEEAFNAKINEHKKALNSHPDFSGDKAKESWESVGRAIAHFGTPDLIETLKKPQFGYDVNIALFLKNIGDLIKPETVLPGKGAPTKIEEMKNSEEARLRRAYPDMFQDKK